MENQVKTSTENKEQQLKKLSKMTMIRSLLPIAGLIIIFLMFNALTNFRMMNNLPLVLSQVYVTMISATGVFFIMTMGGLDFSQGSILGIASIVVCMVSKTSIPLAIVAGIAAGAAIGAINGYFYVYRKIKSFIVTICTMFLFRGFIKYLKLLVQGRIFSLDFFRSHWVFIASVVFLFWLSIANRYVCQTKVETIKYLRFELSNAKTERVRATARYMGLVRHSRIIALVNENKLGLEIPDTPPVKLIPQDGDKE